MDEERLSEIKRRAEQATGNLREQEPGWIVSVDLPPAGCRVYSPDAGIVRAVDYQLFLHAREDILELADDLIVMRQTVTKLIFDALVEGLRQVRFAFTTEADLHHALLEFMYSNGWPVEREVWISDTDRVDLMVFNVAIEVKIGGSKPQVTRQLLRYAESNKVGALILVTAQFKHKLPTDEIGGKRFVAIRVGNTLW